MSLDGHISIQTAPVPLVCGYTTPFWWEITELSVSVGQGCTPDNNTVLAVEWNDEVDIRFIHVTSTANITLHLDCGL